MYFLLSICDGTTKSLVNSMAFVLIDTGTDSFAAFCTDGSTTICSSFPFCCCIFMPHIRNLSFRVRPETCFILDKWIHLYTEMNDKPMKNGRICQWVHSSGTNSAAPCKMAALVFWLSHSTGTGSWKSAALK